MQPASSVLHDETLVPSARFGAALHRCRVRSGARLSALARCSEGRWLPDQLADIERGLVGLDDADVVAAAGLYGMPRRSWAAPSDLELVLDRTSVSEFSHAVPPGDAPLGDFALGDAALGDAEWVGGLASDDDRRARRTAARFAALAVVLGIDLTSGPLRLDALADAIELPLTDTIELLTAVMWDEAPEIGRLIGVFEHRVAVPHVGFLVAETAMGSLLLTARAGFPADGPVVASCAVLGDYLSLRH